ncbi:MAG: toxin-antitoxin system protein [Prosthecobacter sp.]
MPATVRISETGRSLLAQLAREADTSMTVVLDAALETYRRHRFLAQAAAAYETLASDPEAASDYRREITDLDSTSADGLQPYAP